MRADGAKVNTHFRDLSRPMGLAADRTRLAVGTALEIRQYRNMAPARRRLDPPGRHDACYLPRTAHVTGDIDVHEMAWVGDALWFVNTRFSCLCTLNGVHSFVPRWRPPFVSALAPEDRCHLNGLWLSDGRTGRRRGYATALAETDTPQGWRAHKQDGGVLLEVPERRGDRPRPVDAALAAMVSRPALAPGVGDGGLRLRGPAGGRYQPVAELPGFTRGLDFLGDLAFIGLSQVRESAVFSGIPVAERSLEARACGVWVVDIRDGRTVAFLRFEDAVQEVFAVQRLARAPLPRTIDRGPRLAGHDLRPPLRGPEGRARGAPVRRKAAAGEARVGGRGPFLRAPRHSRRSLPLTTPHRERPE